MFAVVRRTASGMPWASTTRWRLQPGRPLSVGFGPVTVPPFSRPPSSCQWPRAPSRFRRPTPVPATARHGVVTTGRVGPQAKAAPARGATATAHLHGQQLPRKPGAQHEQGTHQHLPVDHAGPAPFLPGLRSFGSNGSTTDHSASSSRGFMPHGRLPVTFLKRTLKGDEALGQIARHSLDSPLVPSIPPPPALRLRAPCSHQLQPNSR